MKMKCPVCDAAIPKKEIDSAGYAFCTKCRRSFVFDGADIQNQAAAEPLGNQITEIPEEITKYPPRGTWLKQNAGRIVIGASTRSLTGAIFLVFFAAFWNGLLIFMTVGTVGNVFAGSGISGWMLLFLLPFWLAGIFVASQALMTLFGKIEVVVGRDSYVFTGIGSLGAKKRFDWNAAESIYARTFTSQDSEGGTTRRIYLFIDGGGQVKFGGQLSGEKQSYIVEILKYLLHENRQ